MCAEVVDALLSPSKRPKQASENGLSLGVTTIHDASHFSPLKSTKARDPSLVLTPRKSLQQATVLSRVPLSPRHEFNGLVTPVKSVLFTDVVSPRTSKMLPKSLVTESCHTPVSENKSFAARLMTPGSTRVLRSGQKSMTNVISCSSPEKVVRRNLCDSFIDGSPTKRRVVPVLALAKDNG